MRITSRMLSDAALTSVTAHLEQMERVQNQLSSGKRLTRPSDDPRALGRALDVRTSIATGEQHLRSIEGALAWLNASDAALSSATELLQRAREIALAGANDTVGAQERAAMAEEVDQILQAMVSAGNSAFLGQRLFAGSRTDADPFALSGNPPTATFGGDASQLMRKIDVSTTLAVNVPGAIFTESFGALTVLRDALRGGTAAAISGSIGTLDGALDRLLATRAQVGAKVNLLTTLEGRLRSFQVHLTELLSKEEDTDVAQAASALALQETAYRAALSVASRAIQPSLFEFLR